eukprot:gene63-4920_t
MDGEALDEDCGARFPPGTGPRGAGDAMDMAQALFGELGNTGHLLTESAPVFVDLALLPPTAGQGKLPPPDQAGADRFGHVVEATAVAARPGTGTVFHPFLHAVGRDIAAASDEVVEDGFDLLLREDGIPSALVLLLLWRMVLRSSTAYVSIRLGGGDAGREWASRCPFPNRPRTDDGPRPATYEELLLEHNHWALLRALTQEAADFVRGAEPVAADGLPLAAVEFYEDLRSIRPLTADIPGERLPAAHHGPTPRVFGTLLRREGEAAGAAALACLGVLWLDAMPRGDSALLPLLKRASEGPVTGDDDAAVALPHPFARPTVLLFLRTWLEQHRGLVPGRWRWTAPTRRMELLRLLRRRGIFRAAWLGAETLLSRLLLSCSLSPASRLDQLQEDLDATPYHEGFALQCFTFHWASALLWREAVVARRLAAGRVKCAWRQDVPTMTRWLGSETPNMAAVVASHRPEPAGRFRWWLISTADASGRHACLAPPVTHQGVAVIAVSADLALLQLEGVDHSGDGITPPRVLASFGPEVICEMCVWATTRDDLQLRIVTESFECTMKVARLRCDPTTPYGWTLEGAVVGEVATNSPAWHAGVLPGMEIIAVAGQAIKDAGEIAILLDAVPTGGTAEVELRGPSVHVAVTPERRVVARPSLMRLLSDCQVAETGEVLRRGAIGILLDEADAARQVRVQMALGAVALPADRLEVVQGGARRADFIIS